MFLKRQKTREAGGAMQAGAMQARATRFAAKRIAPGAAALIGAAALLSAALPAAGQAQQSFYDQVPEEMEGVEVTQRLNEQVPFDVEFTNEHGERVSFGDYFADGRPVLLTLNYYTCPQLCHLTLNGLIEGLKELEWSAGEEFNIVTVSINPHEKPDQALAFKNRYAGMYGRETAAEGWAFLTGTEENIQKLADAVGFGFRYDERSGEYAHPSSIQFITPGGRIAQYMGGVIFRGQDLRFALVEASQGTIGSPMDRFLLFTCFQYDPRTNTYAPVAWKVMRSGALLTLVVMALGLTLLWWRGSRFEETGKHSMERSAKKNPETDGSLPAAATSPTAISPAEIKGVES